MQAWILTDGKAGDEVQCLGVAEAMGLRCEIRKVSPRRFWAALMPLGPIDPRDGVQNSASSIAPPFPDIAIASGRRSIAYLRAVKKASDGRTFTVYLKDPRFIKIPVFGSKAADFIWAPDHDRISGANVMTTLTSPHRLHADVLEKAKRCPDERLLQLPHPRIALLLGGNSKVHRFSKSSITRLVDVLSAVLAAKPGEAPYSIMATTSRRTPPELAAAIKAVTQRSAGFFWDGSGPNPLVSMLALADHIIVTADSVNMVGEALATGKPVHIFEPDGGSRKTSLFLHRLFEKKLARRLAFPLGTWTYEPVNATAEIALEIEQRFAAHREALATL